MYLKIVIITILIIIIIKIIFSSSNNEHLNIKLTKSNITDINNLTKEYYNNQSIRTFNDMRVLNKFMINNVELKDIISNIRYPVGCYYVQYPENNTNINEYDDIDINDMETLFPAARSPEVLFGGKWEEKFNGDSVFFRTGGILSDDARLNGVQPYAMKNLYGWTSVSQTNLWNPGYGSQGILEESEQTEVIETDGKKMDSAYIGYIIGAIFAGILTVLTFGLAAPLLVVAMAPAIAFYAYGAVYLTKQAIRVRDATDWLYFGPPSKPGDTVDAKRGQLVKDRGTGLGHQNLMDPSLQSPVSSLELRVRNRIMKVWKRIA